MVVGGSANEPILVAPEDEPQLRAIEHRRYLVRATNSGVSAIVDPAGRILGRTGLLTRENLHGTVHPLAGTTVYASLGDWPGWLGALLVALGLAIGKSSTRLHHLPTPPDTTPR